MIDLMNSGLNGTNGKSDHVPCPFCSQLAVMQHMLKSVATFEDENPIFTLDALIAEVKMWRSKDEYNSKLHRLIKQSVIKKLEDNGFQMES